VISGKAVGDSEDSAIYVVDVEKKTGARVTEHQEGQRGRRGDEDYFKDFIILFSGS
jgi:hypothetical protein